MTNGLLISRNTKICLHKTYLVNPNPLNKSTYKAYRNLYNSVLRCSKKLYFENNLKAHAKNPKKPGISSKKPSKLKVPVLKSIQLLLMVVA